MQAQKKAQPSRSQLTLQLFSAGFYATMAVSMNFVNKAALREFPLSNVLLLNQMLLALLILPTLKVGAASLCGNLTLRGRLSGACN